MEQGFERFSALDSGAVGGVGRHWVSFVVSKTLNSGSGANVARRAGSNEIGRPCIPKQVPAL